MTVKPAVLFGAVGGVILAFLGWLLPSMLQGAQDRVNAEALLHTERARRILHEYNAQLGYKSVVLGDVESTLASLATVGVEGDFSLDSPSDLSEDAQQEYEDRHKAAWEAFKPMDWAAQPRPREASASYGNIAQQAQQGIALRKELMQKNAGLLNEALKEVDAGLAVSSGSVDAKQHVEANRLKGVIHYHQGAALATLASAKRRESIPLRAELLSLDSEAGARQPLTNLMVGSQVEVRIREIESKSKECDERIARFKTEADKLDGQIREMEKKLASAKSRADEARSAIDALKTKGVDFSNLKGADDFAAAMLAHDKVYREAIREVQGLERATLPTASIDMSGDYLNGQYVEASGGKPVVAPGLIHYRTERAVVAAQLAKEEQFVADLRATTEALSTSKTRRIERQQGIVKELNGLADQAIELDKALRVIEEEALKLEESALGAFQKSAAALKAASTGMDQIINAARDEAQNLPPSKQDKAASTALKDDRWIGGYITAEIADAHLARAWVYQQRYVHYRDHARAYKDLYGMLRLEPADPKNPETGERQSKSDEARAAAAAEVEQAMKHLGDAHGKVGKHWTITALSAGARSVMVLLDYPQYLNEVIADYQEAAKGREDKDYARWIVDRIAALEARKQ